MALTQNIVLSGKIHKHTETTTHKGDHPIHDFFRSLDAISMTVNYTRDMVSGNYELHVHHCIIVSSESNCYHLLTSYFPFIYLSRKVRIAGKIMASAVCGR